MTLHKSIAIIGAGHLGSALIRGLIKSGYPREYITISNRNHEKSTCLADELGVTAAASNTEAITNKEVIILAVKPQFMQEVCQDIATSIQHDQLIISLAGVTETTSISLWLKNNLEIVRVMTNTPMEFCRGISALFANPNLTLENKGFCTALFNAVGSSLWVEEEETLDPLTAAIGCAPAYVLLFMEALQTAAMSQNIPEKTAEQIAIELMIGTVTMVEQSRRSFTELRAGVTTKNGVTEHSLKQFSTEEFFDQFKQIYQAAHERINQIKLTSTKE